MKRDFIVVSPMMVGMTKLSVPDFSRCPVSVACSSQMAPRSRGISFMMLRSYAVMTGVSSWWFQTWAARMPSPCLLHCQSQLLIHLMQYCMTRLCCHTLALYCQHCVDPWTVYMRALQISWSSWQWNAHSFQHNSASYVI